MKKHLVELKATSTDHDRQRERLLAAGADFRGTDHQVDHYFRVPEGRLKLRVGNVENSLIFYRRENTATAKNSDANLTPLDHAATARELAATLDAALGTLVVVDKQREIYFIDNVKFHLDTIAGLGTFVEIEAIGAAEKERDALRGQVDRYQQLLGIQETELQSVSYSDMLLQQQADGAA
ncbi:class IV adenylate cyclase [Lewinella sp. IMCC34183]|uniref:class IV adenylate cyclase n=1 Tax=Lewinella sp. IMCC34183 TaxID=2248762 RepID=UPI000E23F6D4|nr:class IV adenylate cyclase [Lewinella sp. IMCC34183]